MQLSSLMIQPGPPIPKAATLRDALGRTPSESAVAEALFRAVRSSEDSEARDLEVDAYILGCAKRLEQRYLDDSWTWRR